MILEYQDPPNKWLLDGIATEKAVSDAQLLNSARSAGQIPTAMGHKIWVNYNELTTSSLEIIVSKGNHPQMALIQVSE